MSRLPTNRLEGNPPVEVVCAPTLRVRIHFHFLISLIL